jgi:hypothetical protein
MTEIVAIWKALLAAGILAWLWGTVAFGLIPLIRIRRKRKIFRTERVLFSSEVNTELCGYQIGKNHAGPVLLTLAFALLFAVQAGSALLVIGCFLYIAALTSMYHRSRPHQKIQGFVLTDRGVWLFPENLGRPLWNPAGVFFTPWSRVAGYKIDGSYVQFFGGGVKVVQIEYSAHDYWRVKAVLSDLGVKRLELADRLWVAQVDEERFLAMEDEINDLGWNLLELFQEELQSLNLRPEFGVMRNIPGDRLFEEQARSWLQLNLIDTGTGEKVAGSSFLLWHSTGSVGHLIGISGQELVDSLQEWIKKTLREAEAAKEVIIS